MKLIDFLKGCGLVGTVKVSYPLDLMSTSVYYGSEVMASPIARVAILDGGRRVLVACSPERTRPARDADRVLGVDPSFVGPNALDEIQRLLAHWRRMPEHLTGSQAISDLTRVLGGGHAPGPR